jgi:hypothetical protein
LSTLYFLVLEFQEISPSKLDTICLLTVQRLASNDESVKQSIVTSSVIETYDTVTKCNSWLAAQKVSEDSALVSVQGSIAGATLLLRVLSISNSMQYSRMSGSKGVKSMSSGGISEEVVERAIHLVHSFLNTNIVTASRAVAMKEEPSAKVKGKAKSASESLHRKLVADVVRFLQEYILDLLN